MRQVSLSLLIDEYVWPTSILFHLDWMMLIIVKQNCNIREC